MYTVGVNERQRREIAPGKTGPCANGLTHQPKHYEHLECDERSVRNHTTQL